MPLSVKNFLIAEEVKKVPQARQENPFLGMFATNSCLRV